MRPYSGCRVIRAWSLYKDSRHEESQNEGFGVLICSSCVSRVLAGNPDSPALITSGTIQNSLKPKSWRDCYGDWVLETIPCGLEEQEVSIRFSDLNFVSKINSLNTAAVILLKFVMISGYVWMDSWCSKCLFLVYIEIFLGKSHLYYHWIIKYTQYFVTWFLHYL